MVRRIDDLGRIVIPKEVRRKLAINQGDGLEFLIDGNGGIVLRKYTSICFVCGGENGVQEYNQAYLCQDCREKLGIAQPKPSQCPDVECLDDLSE